MSPRKHEVRKTKSFERKPVDRASLTGTTLKAVAILLQETHAMVSTGSTYSIDSNEPTTSHILNGHLSKFSDAWKTLADR